MAWLTLLGPDANVKRYRLDSDSNIWSCQVPRHVGSRSSDDQLPTEALRSRSRDSRTKSWKAAKHWNLHDKQLTDEELSSFIFTGATDGLPMCVYPVSSLAATKIGGEPCISLDVYFSPDWPNWSSSLETTRFAVGHCYSIRAAVYDASDDQELWVQLRDPRRSRLLWAKWSNIVHAGDSTCIIYVCEGACESSAA